MQPYERFEAWKKAHAFAVEVHKATRAWPTEERYGLTSQGRRAAFSVALNIVEGSARRGRREFRRFLDIAWASLAEVGYVLILARDLGIMAETERDRLEAARSDVARPLYKLMRAMETDP